MSGNEKSYSRYLDDSLQSTNWILDSGETFHMTPHVSDFIPGLLEDTDKFIEVVDGHHVTAKQKGRVQIKMCDNTEDPFVDILPKIILAPDICDRLFSIIMLIDLGHTCLFHKGFCTA